MAKNFLTNILLGGKVLPSLNNAFNSANKKMLQVNKTGTVFAKTTGVMSKTFSRASRFIGLDTLIMGAGFAYVGQKGLMLASDLTEVQNVIDVTFEKSAKQIDAWAKAADKSFGLTELQAKEYVGTMGAMLKTTGLSNDMFLMMSKNLTGLAGDIASFHNLDVADAFTKIRSGISGETEPLKALGINMSVANMEAFALSKGIKTAWSKMNQANQTAIRYAYLMEVTKDKQGDFTRNQDEFANQLRLTKNNFDRITSTIIGKFLPTANKAITWANKFMDNLDMDKISRSVESFGNKTADVFINYIKPSFDWAVQEGWPAFKDGTTKAFEAAKWFTGVIVDNWPLIEPILFGLAAGITANKIAMMLLNRESLIGMGVTALSKAWAGATFVLEWMRAGLSLTTLAQWALNGAMAANPIGVIVVGIGILGGALYALYKNWDKITKFFVDSWTKVKNVFSSNIDSPKISGLSNSHSKMRGFANGGFSNRAAIFGEAGLEAAIPIKPGNPRSIGLLNKTAQLLGVGGGSMVIQYSPIVQVTGGGDVAEQAQKGIEAAYPGFENIIDKNSSERRRLSYA